MLQKVHVTYKGRALQRGGVTYKVCMLQRAGVTYKRCAQTYVRMETLSCTSLRTLVVMDILICRVKVTKNKWAAISKTNHLLQSYIKKWSPAAILYWKMTTSCNPISKNDHQLQSYIENWSPAEILHRKLVTCCNPVSKNDHLLQSYIENDHLCSPVSKNDHLLQSYMEKYHLLQSYIKYWSPAAILYWKFITCCNPVSKIDHAAILHQKMITCCNPIWKNDHLLYQKIITCCNPLSKIDHLLQSCIKNLSPAAICVSILYSCWLFFPHPSFTRQLHPVHQVTYQILWCKTKTQQTSLKKKKKKAHKIHRNNAHFNFNTYCIWTYSAEKSTQNSICAYPTKKMKLYIPTYITHSCATHTSFPSSSFIFCSLRFATCKTNKKHKMVSLQVAMRHGHTPNLLHQRTNWTHQRTCTHQWTRINFCLFVFWCL